MKGHASLITKTKASRSAPDGKWLRSLLLLNVRLRNWCDKVLLVQGVEVAHGTTKAAQEMGRSKPGYFSDLVYNVDRTSIKHFAENSDGNVDFLLDGSTDGMNKQWRKWWLCTQKPKN